MRRVRRSAIVPHSVADMYAIVDDVASYPEFMPWCSDARELERSEELVVASLELSRGGLSRWFTTRNCRDTPHRLDMTLVDGPFRALDGGWHFRELGGNGAEIRLDIEFEFDSLLVGLTFGPLFEYTCNSLVDAFVGRAAALHGRRRR